MIKSITLTAMTLVAFILYATCAIAASALYFETEADTIAFNIEDLFTKYENMKIYGASEKAVTEAKEHLVAEIKNAIDKYSISAMLYQQSEEDNKYRGVQTKARELRSLLKEIELY